VHRGRPAGQAQYDDDDHDDDDKPLR